jgi:hypothetical protein
VADVALDLDVSPTTVRRWLVVDDGRSPVRVARSRRADSPLRGELDQLRRQIRSLELEVELLKWIAVKMSEQPGNRRA